MLFHISMMSTGTFYVYPLQRLTFMLKVYPITRLDILITRKGNLFKANLRASLAILMTCKGSLYKAILQASKGHRTVLKDSITTLPVNLCSLSRGTNRGRYMVLGENSNLPNPCNLSILLIQMLLTS